MPRIYFLPDEVEVVTEPGESILEASLRAGLSHTHLCGGNARCSTCRVLILEGLQHCPPPNTAETAIAERLRFSQEIRLACQTVVAGDVRLRRLVLDPADVELTDLEGGAAAGSVGREREVTVLFADLRRFSSLAEALLPYDVIHVLNRYFYEVGRVIRRHEGAIVSYMGDGLMALFESEDSEQGPLRAVRAGLGMLQAVEGLNAHLRELYGWGLEANLGAHHGAAVIGTVGAPGQRQQFSVIGDTVNIASRLETANKHAGTRFLVSEAVFRRLGDRVEIGRTLRLPLPGLRDEHNVYEVTGYREEDQ
ncbi:MAG: adenylate/guanylate cyclase domain-containing protein [Actinomycetota bacterium]|nr:adenylate/guanylate cyclase domain-containing protein [Actinomycetota bacterium]